jgi:small RNA 2'-O-methyltransferase
MAIVQLSSTNPHFSFIIKKNPSSGMMARTIRKGTAFGWYTDASSYHIFFKDADNDISYKQPGEESFEYLNVSRYNTALFSLNAISEFFSSPLKKQHEHDTEGYEHTFFVNMVYVADPRYVDFFRTHFTDVDVRLEQLIHKSYAVTMRTERPLHHLINTANLLFLFLALVGKEQMDVTEGLCAKYIQNIQAVDAPFFIRYLLQRNMLHQRRLFNRFKEQLEQTDRYQIRFAYGNTARQRRDALQQMLAFDKSQVCRHFWGLTAPQWARR